MLESIIRKEVLAGWSRKLSLEKADGATPIYSTLANKDIFGQDRLKLKTQDSARYFECVNCQRKIAGARFAQHVNKCLTRTRK